MEKIKNALPSFVLMALLIDLWVVVATDSLIFPMPGQVVAGTMELAADGTLWDHITASLFRVGCAFLLAVVVAVPMGLWMGRHPACIPSSGATCMRRKISASRAARCCGA